MVFQGELFAMQTIGDTIIARGDYYYPPYEYLEDGEPVGFNIDLLNEIAKLKNLNVKIILGSWKQARTELENGEIDMITGMFSSEERAKKVDFSMMHSVVTYELFMDKSEEKFDLSETGRKIITVQEGGIMQDILEQNYPDILFITTKSTRDALNLVGKNEANGTLIPKMQGHFLIEKDNRHNLKGFQVNIQPFKYCFAVRKKNRYLLGVLNAGIAELMDNGRYNEIYEKWFGEYQQRTFIEKYQVVIFTFILAGMMFVISMVWSYTLNQRVKQKTSELRQVMDLTPYVLYARDKEGNFILGNKALADKYFTDVKSIKSIAPYCERNQINFNEILDDDESFLQNNSERVVRKYEIIEGGKRKIYKNFKVLFNRLVDNERAVLNIAVDITESEVAKRKLKQSESKFRQLVEQASVIIIVHDLDGKIVDVNRTGCHLLGDASENIIGRSINEIETKTDLHQKKLMWRNITKGKIYTIESSFKRKNGTFFPVEVRLGLIEIDDQKLILSLSHDIGDRKEKESRIKLQSAALSAAAEGIVITNAVGVIVWVNQAFTTLTGYEIDEAIGQTTGLLRSGKQGEEFYKNLWDTLLSGNTWKGIMVNKRKDGSLYYEESTINSVKDRFGEITNFISVKVDITERMQSEQILNDQMQRFKHIFKYAPVGICQFDNNLVLGEFNDKFITIFRSTKKKLTALNLSNLQDVVIVPYLKKAIAGENAHYEGPYRTTTSDVDVFMAFHATPHYSTDGKIIGGIAIVEDITEMKMMQSELEESEKKYRSIFNNLVDVYYKADLNGKLLLVSPSYKTLVGDVDLNAIIGENISEVFYHDENERSNLLKELDKKGRVRNFQIRLNDNGDKPVYIETNSHYVYDNSGNPIAVEGMVRDVTERLIAERELKYSENKLRNLVEYSSDGIVLTDETGRVVEWNPAMEFITQTPYIEAINEFIWDIQYKLLPAKFKRGKNYKTYIKIIKGMLERGRKLSFKNYFELVMQRPDGEVRVLQSSIATIKRNDGNMLVSIIRDVSSIKEMENQLFLAKENAEKSDRLKSEFLAQMSHEIRTPINSILSFTSLIREELEESISDDLDIGFNVIDNAGKRIIRTIDLILNMSAVQTGTYEFNPQKIDIQKDVLSSIYEEFYLQAKEKGIVLELINKSVDPVIFADNYTVSQIFNNLVDNAVKYTPVGSVKILIYDTGNTITVSVSDTGIGISEEFLPDLFTVFTQEEQGYTRRFEGNGLGLALVKKYCELNGAEINVESSKGKGTTFTIQFYNI